MEETQHSAEETRFADIGKREAVRRLYEGTPYQERRAVAFDADGKGDTAVQAGKLLLEGVDFDLVYFPLKHLGYKAVVAVTGELLAALAHPRTLSVLLGISAKLDFAQIRELWGGIVAAAREFGYADVALDLQPSRNGLAISVSATGSTPLLTAKRRPAPKSKDLLCVSGSLGAAYLGFRLLEREKRAFEAGKPSADLETNRMLVGASSHPWKKRKSTRPPAAWSPTAWPTPSSASPWRPASAPRSMRIRFLSKAIPSSSERSWTSIRSRPR